VIVLKKILTFALLFTSISFSQGSAITDENIGIGTNRKSAHESQYNNARTLFTIGSVMTFAGLISITVSGNDDLVLPIGGTLFGIGHAGLIMTGVSTSKMKRIAVEANKIEEFSWVPKSGWINYSVGWGLIAAGIPVMVIGINNDISPMVFGGIAGLILGEAMHISSWFKFNKNRKYWTKGFENNLSFLPGIYFDENRSCVVNCNLKYNF